MTNKPKFRKQPEGRCQIIGCRHDAVYECDGREVCDGHYKEKSIWRSLAQQCANRFGEEID
jgi:hypothetical protein